MKLLIYSISIRALKEGNLYDPCNFYYSFSFLHGSPRSSSILIPTSDWLNLTFINIDILLFPAPFYPGHRSFFFPPFFFSSLFYFRYASYFLLYSEPKIHLLFSSGRSFNKNNSITSTEIFNNLSLSLSLCCYLADISFPTRNK